MPRLERSAFAKPEGSRQSPWDNFYRIARLSIQPFSLSSSLVVCSEALHWLASVSGAFSANPSRPVRVSASSPLDASPSTASVLVSADCLIVCVVGAVPASAVGSAGAIDSHQCARSDVGTGHLVARLRHARSRIGRRYPISARGIQKKTRHRCDGGPTCTCRNLGLSHVPCGNWGTPRLDQVLSKIQKMASQDFNVSESASLRARGFFYSSPSSGA